MRKEPWLSAAPSCLARRRLSVRRDRLCYELSDLRTGGPRVCNGVVAVLLADSLQQVSKATVVVRRRHLQSQSVPAFGERTQAAKSGLPGYLHLGVTSCSALQVRREVAHLLHLSHLDHLVGAAGAALGPLDGLIAGPHVDQPVAADNLLWPLRTAHPPPRACQSRSGRARP